MLHELVTGSRWNAATGATEAMPPADWVPVLSGPLAQGSTEHRDSGRRATVIFVASLVALAAVAGVVALTDDGGDVATMAPVTEQPASDNTSLANTTVALPETVPAATVPPATDPPTTVAPETTISAARALGQELADLLAQKVSEGLDRDAAIAIVDRLNEAILAAEPGQADEVERALRDARRRIDRDVDEDSRDNAIALLLALGVELGVDPDLITDDPKSRGDDDDD